MTIDMAEDQFLGPDRMPGESYVTSDKVNFRPDIKQKLFLKKIRT